MPSLDEPALEMTPEPGPEEREALLRALAPLLAPPRDLRSEWWREGVRDGLSPEAEPA